MLLKQRRLSVFGGHSTKQELECSTPPSENSWVGSLSLKRVVRPDLEHERHRDTSLRITIHESKNLPSQKRYFCDICLDRKLYARTTSKLSKETVFWGECFDLNNLVELNFITINLYREADSMKDPSKRRKSNKGQNQLVAFLTIAISDLTAKYETQQWHTMTPASMLPSSESLNTNSISSQSSIRQSLGSFNPSDSAHNSPDSYTGYSAKRSISLVGPPPTSLLSGRIRKLSRHNMGGSESKMNAGQSCGSSKSDTSSLPQIRLAVKYQSIDVLPLRCYDDLRKLVVEKSTKFVDYLEPFLQTKQKEEIARCLVNIHEKAAESSIAAFLAPLVDRELDSYDNLSLLFRSNSIGSKAVECYIKLVGAEYLQKLLRGFIENLLTSNEDLEVDPLRLAGQAMSPVSDSGSSNPSTDIENGLLQRNQTALVNSVKIVWRRLQNSLSYFPADLRETLASIRRTVEHRHGQEVGDQLVSGCLFLRYICPAIHGPTLFGLTNAVPDDPRVSRNLTLLAKVLQTIANFSHFEAKENYMRFLNTFVQSMQEEMHQFLQAVSTMDEDDSSGIWKRQKVNVSNCHNNIDLSYEFTILYRHLLGVLEEHPQIPDCLSELPSILAGITHMLSTPSLRRSVSNLATSMRSATSASLEDAGALQSTVVRFHSTVNQPSLSELQLTPGEQPATPLSISANYTPKCISPTVTHRCNFDISSPSSEGPTCQQAFFGEAFESGVDNSRSTDLESISEAEAPSSSPVARIFTSPTPQSKSLLQDGKPPTETSVERHRSTSAQPHKTPQTSGSLQRRREVETCGINGGDSTTANTLQMTPPQKWPSGPDLHADTAVVLNFPPPPPPLPQQQKDGVLSGSSTNIRMGTRAIRMSRERDLTESLDTGVSMRNGEEGRESLQLSTVPVILQCEAPIAVPGSHTTTSTVPGRRRGGDGSILSVDSTPSYESSSASSSSCLSMMPPTNNVSINGGGQGVFVAENAHYFELPAERAIPTVVQRGCCIPNSNGNPSSSNSNPALLSRVHHLLFGGGCEGSGNDYQNVRSLVRSSPSSRRPEMHQEHSSLDSRQSEASQLEVLQQRLLAMEEHLSQERRDMQKAVASNMRMMESQERCINELIEEINRLQNLRGNVNSSSAQPPSVSSASSNRRSGLQESTLSTPQSPQQQFPLNSWW